MGLVLKKTILISLFAIVLTSCDQGLVYEENLSLENQVWKKSQSPVFEVEVLDTLQKYNFYLNIRHGEDYEYSNLFLFMKTEFPDKKVARDTMEFILQNSEGKWNGTGLGSLRDNQILFKKDLQFPYLGKYRFALEQAMREEELKHISEVGLRIEKSNSN